jgi:hypothetical protein
MSQDSEPPSQRTQPLFYTKANLLILYKEIVVYSRIMCNTKHAMCGQNADFFSEAASDRLLHNSHLPFASVKYLAYSFLPRWQYS